MSNKIFAYSLVLICVLILSGWIGSWHRAMKTGTEAYQRGNYDAALEAFQEATFQKPENISARYNLGTALYKKGRFKEAVQAFQKALSTDDIDNQASAYYNLGNAQFQTGDLTKAIESYRHSLRLQPTWPDVRHNLELALQRIQQQPTGQTGKQPQRKPTKNGKISKFDGKSRLKQLTENENRIRQKLLKQQLKTGYRRETDW